VDKVSSRRGNRQREEGPRRASRGALFRKRGPSLLRRGCVLVTAGCGDAAGPFLCFWGNFPGTVARSAAPLPSGSGGGPFPSGGFASLYRFPWARAGVVRRRLGAGSFSWVLSLFSFIRERRTRHCVPEVEKVFQTVEV
jgi:hypothetical protein